MITLGINSAYHEVAVAVVRDGVLVAAIEQERINRIKKGKVVTFESAAYLPYEAMDLALSIASAEFNDVDLIGFSYEPEKRYTSVIEYQYPYPIPASRGANPANERRMRDFALKAGEFASLRYAVDVTSRWRNYSHHKCHAASAYHLSGYSDAAVLVADGIGEFDSTTRWHGKEGRLKLLHAIPYPHSIGFLWEYMTTFLGFRRTHDEYKVMGLAAYGDPNRFMDKFAHFFKIDDQGFSINESILRFRGADMSELEKLLGPRRYSHEPLKYSGQDTRHADIAAALQRLTTQAILNQARYCAEETNAHVLCMAGGVALNCVTNGQLAEINLFDDIWIQPASHDAGTAIGAATLAWHELTGEEGVKCSAPAFLGPQYGDFEIEQLLKAWRLPYRRLNGGVELVVDRLVDGQVLARFDGRMEFGPRALGNRSIIGDPRSSEIRETINAKIKRRELFRPLCPSVLSESIYEWFDVPKPMPSAARYMLMTFKIHAEQAYRVPAIVHEDGTARIQAVDVDEAPRFHHLIKAFANRTGVPMLLNTSFNSQEPIVCTPEHALRTFLETELDGLVIGDFMVDRPQ